MITTLFGRKIGLGTILGLCIFSVSILLFGLILYDRYKLKFGDYEKVVGVVIKSSVESLSAGTGGSSRSRVDYYPRIKYRYRINDVVYYGNSRDSISISVTNTNQDIAAKVVQRFPVGAPIDVWYDPDEHNISIVEVQKIDFFSKLPTVIVFILLGVFSIWVDRWMIRVKEAQNA